jgi:hypothetical protein
VTREAYDPFLEFFLFLSIICAGNCVKKHIIHCDKQQSNVFTITVTQLLPIAYKTDLLDDLSAGHAVSNKGYPIFKA